MENERVTVQEATGVNPSREEHVRDQDGHADDTQADKFMEIQAMIDAGFQLFADKMRQQDDKLEKIAEIVANQENPKHGMPTASDENQITGVMGDVIETVRKSKKNKGGSSSTGLLREENSDSDAESEDSDFEDKRKASMTGKTAAKADIYEVINSLTREEEKYVMLRPDKDNKSVTALACIECEMKFYKYLNKKVKEERRKEVVLARYIYLYTAVQISYDGADELFDRGGEQTLALDKVIEHVQKTRIRQAKTANNLTKTEWGMRVPSSSSSRPFSNPSRTSSGVPHTLTYPCFNCWEHGHTAKFCSNPKREKPASAVVPSWYVDVTKTRSGNPTNFNTGTGSRNV
jgi:hypothetical protein